MAYGGKIFPLYFFALTYTPIGYIMYAKIKAEDNIMGSEKEKCCCSDKKTERDTELKKSLINRLSRIEGQIRGIKGMIENNAYCNDVLIQSAAVNAAVSAFNRELLKNHMHTCVLRDIKAGDESVIDELAETVYKLMR